MRVLLPSSTEPTVTKRRSSLRSFCSRKAWMSLLMSSVSASCCAVMLLILEVPLALLLLHGPVLIEVDEAVLTL